jgi:FkbM family methyltransferase
MDHLQAAANHQSDSPWGTFAPGFMVKHWLKLLHQMPVSSTSRRLALWLRKPLKFLMDGWVDIEVWGLRLRLRSKGNLSEQRLIYMPQFLDQTERKALADALKDGGLFLDIGANAGIYSLWMASLRNSNIKVEAFEPDPELCAGMSFNLVTNQIRNVTLNQMALGRQEGRMRLVTGDGNKGENRVEADGVEGEGHEVEMTTLKQFIERRGIERITAVKIDIEGHEVDVLEPFFQDCPEAVWPRLLICEVVHDTDCRLADLLDRSGYKIAGKGRLNTIFQRKISA